jgi:hypothetical protein
VILGASAVVIGRLRSGATRWSMPARW